MANRYLKYNNKLLSLNGKFIKIDVTTVNKIPESKTVTPTTTQQIITPTDSDHELTKVIVNAIPDEYIVSDYTFSFDETTGTLTITNGD